MCFNCGCRMPEDDMGHPDNITTGTLRVLAKKRKVKLAELMHDLAHYLEKPPLHLDSEYEDMFKKAAKAWGQSVKEGKRQTYNLLKHRH